MVQQPTGRLEGSVNYLRGFRRHLGIAADVTLGIDDEPWIVMETKEFNHRRAWLETWFVRIDQQGNYSFLKERTSGGL